MRVIDGYYKSFQFPDYHFILTSGHFHPGYDLTVYESLSYVELRQLLFQVSSLIKDCDLTHNFLKGWYLKIGPLPLPMLLSKLGFFISHPITTSFVCYFQYNAFPEFKFILRKHCDIEAACISGISLESLDILMPLLDRFSPRLRWNEIHLPLCTVQDVKNFLLQADFSLLGEDVSYIPDNP